MIRGSAGFTLIELMIAIAILAILAAVPRASANSVHQLSREDHYRHALSNANHQMEWLSRQSFESLPPRVVKVSSDGQVRISQPRLVEDSVRFYTEQGPIEASAAGSGRYRLGPEWAGKKVVANYSFDVPDKGEAAVVDAQGRARLRNLPVEEVVAVHQAQGPKLQPVTKFKVGDRERGVLELDPGLAGKVVVVDYLGESLKNRVSGEFVDQEFRPASRPTKTKVLRLAERYGGAWRFELELVRSSR